MGALRESQAGLESENKMTDEAILGEVLGTRRGFNPGRGRRPRGSSSSSSSAHSHPPPLPLSRAAFERCVMALQQQIEALYEHLANANIQLPPPVVLDPSQFMDADEDSTDDDSSAHSHPPPKPVSRAAFARYVTAHQQQFQVLYEHLANANIHLPPPVMLDPSEFMDADEDAAAPGDE
ncbi:hypothetical protein CTI12_AA619990 [Artemisia annua]|uniref:Uncharacterized protein n=1 Tax=Artemisia annua TaxID=35608 RepID=A0A2U1K9C0_ARTAN|nr:hypothetical protein CTI12_AA619990 [Artemisia annua]